MLSPARNPRPDEAALLRLAAELPARSSRFLWCDWSADDHTAHNCGLFGCVGGHAAELFPDRLRLNDCGFVRLANVPDKDSPSGTESFARVFGLTVNEAEAITLGFPAAPISVVSPDGIRIWLEPVPDSAIGASARILAVLAIAKNRHRRLSALPSE